MKLELNRKSRQYAYFDFEGRHGPTGCYLPRNLYCRQLANETGMSSPTWRKASERIEKEKPPFGLGGFDLRCFSSRLSSSRAVLDLHPNHITPVAKDERNKRNDDDNNKGERFEHSSNYNSRNDR